jgi:hypothetical protein
MGKTSALSVFFKGASTKPGLLVLICSFSGLISLMNSLLIILLTALLYILLVI